MDKGFENMALNLLGQGGDGVMTTEVYTEKFTCPTCEQETIAVGGDTHIGTRYDSGRWDSQGWRRLECGHYIGVYDYADGTRQIVPITS